MAVSTEHLLFTRRSRDEHLKLTLKMFNKTEEELKEYLNTLKEWFKLQRHLPTIPDDAMMTNFLFLNKFSIENTKTKIDMYYSIRNILPELFENKNPSRSNMRELQDTIYIIPLPKTSKEGYRVTIYGVKEYSDQFDPYDFYGHACNVAEVRLREDISTGETIVFDFAKVRMGHLMKITPIYIKKTATVLEKVFSNQIKGMHYINCPAYAETIISLVRQILKPKLAQRLHVHKIIDELQDFIPKEILPADLGGEEMSLDELNEMWKKKFVEYQDTFDFLEEMRTNESLRPTPLVNDEILGFHGTFKKLNVD